MLGDVSTFGNHKGVVAAVNWGHFSLHQWAPPLLWSMMGVRIQKNNIKSAIHTSAVMVPPSGTMISLLLLVKSDSHVADLTLRGGMGWGGVG